MAWADNVSPLNQLLVVSGAIWPLDNSKVNGKSFNLEYDLAIWYKDHSDQTWSKMFPNDQNGKFE